MAATLNVGQTDTMTLVALDASGNLITNPVFDTPPSWSVDDSSLVTLTPSSDGLSATAVASAQGTATISVSASANGNAFSAQDILTINVPVPQIASIQINDSVA